jgi:hypothetical protein
VCFDSLKDIVGRMADPRGDEDIEVCTIPSLDFEIDETSPEFQKTVLDACRAVLPSWAGVSTESTSVCHHVFAVAHDSRCRRELAPIISGGYRYGPSAEGSPTSSSF